MNLKELLQNKKVQDHYGIVIRDNVPTLKFAEDIRIIGINIEKDQIAVIPHNTDKINIDDIVEILLNYNIISFLSDYDLKKKKWELNCTWLNEEESEWELEKYSENRAILILHLAYAYPKLDLKELYECDTYGLS